MNTAMLKSKMVLHGDTNAKLANAMGLSPQRLSAKINETAGAEFNKHEIQFIKVRYSLTSDEVDSIFFAS